jgi:hypothetical protein
LKKFLVLSIFAIIFSSCNFEEKGEDLAGGLFAENQIVEDSYIVSPASSKTYYDTEVVSFQITHPFILTVTGVPRISIDVGGVSRFANYNSGTGTKTLTFQYTVVTGDTDSDGIESGPLIDFNGGNIQFNNGTSTTTTTTAVSSLAMNAVIIDAGVPSVTAVFPTSLPASTLYNEQVANVAVVFNDFVTVTGSPQLLLDIGGTPVLADYSVGSGGSILYFTYSITGTDVDVDGFETQLKILLVMMLS